MLPSPGDADDRNTEQQSHEHIPARQAVAGDGEAIQKAIEARQAELKPKVEVNEAIDQFREGHAAGGPKHGLHLEQPRHSVVQ